MLFTLAEIVIFKFLQIFEISIYNFISSRPSQFIVVPIEKTNNQYYVSLTPIVIDDLNKEEAENDDFIWVSSGEL